jgi:hypothetical protein
MILKISLSFFALVLLIPTSTYAAFPGGVGAPGTGTVGNPFTSIYAATVSGMPAGVYNFNIGGQVFSSYVDATGWVLVESGKASTNETTYAQVSALTLQSDAVLTPAVLATLDISSVRMNSTLGVAIDVTSTNVLVANRIRANQILSQATGDQTMWTGSVPSGMTVSCAPTVVGLKDRIWHSCGNAGHLHWQPMLNNDGYASLANDTDLNLWVRSTTPNLNLWLKANTGAANTGDATTATTWTDQTGVNTFTTNNTPTFFANPGSNFNPAVRFNGINTSYTGATYITMNDAYTVAKFANPTLGNQGTIFGTDTFTGAALYYFGVVTGTTDLYVGSLSGGSYSYNFITTPSTYSILNARATGDKNYQLNGKLMTTIGGAPNSAPPVLGKRKAGGGTFDQFFNGDVNEVINYATALSNSDRQKVDTYLAVKYGITLDQTTPLSYLDTAGTTIWDGTANAIYNKNITGIGRDDIEELNQKQSKSINTTGLVTVGRGGISTTNALNSNTFSTDKSYFIFGDDNGALAWSPLGAPTNRHVLSRKFKVQSSAFAESLKISAPDNSSTLATKLPPEVSNAVYLLVDNDGDGNFTTGTQQEIALTLVGTNWELASPLSSIPNGAVFTLGTVAPAATPGGVAGSKLWLDASSNVANTGDNTTVTGWTDKSGVANDWSANTGTPKYRTNTANLYNFNPIVYFDGTSAITTSAVGPLGNSSSYTKYVVYKPHNIIGGNLVSSSGSNSHALLNAGSLHMWHTGSFLSTPPNFTVAEGKYIGMAKYTGLGAPDPNRIKVNGLQIDANPSVIAYTDNGAIQIGGNSTPANTFTNTDIAEVIVYDGANTNVEIVKIESYLASKYGITIDQSAGATNYFDSSTAVYWNAVTNSVYSNNITVIGRDDTSALNQKQSKSVNAAGLVTIGKGVISATNALNASIFAADRDYLAFGDNNLAVTSWTSAGAPAARQILSRSWKVSEKGTDATDYKIQVPDDSSVLATKLPTEATSVYLLQDADGDFTAGATSTVMTLVGTNWEVSGADLDNGQFFTFATIAPGITQTPTLTVTEGGVSGSVSIVLNAPPLSNVVVNVSSSNTGNATVAPAALTFTSLNWNVPQVVIVTPVTDSNTVTDSMSVIATVDDALSSNEYDPVADTATAVTVLEALVAVVRTSGGSVASTLSPQVKNNPQTINTQTIISVTTNVSTSLLEGTEPNVSSEFTSQVCKRYLKEYILPDSKNNPEEVKKLQEFLNEQGEKLAVDGIYDANDVEAVKRFQAKYLDQIMTPWGVSAPTGRVYKTTTAKINLMMCAKQKGCPYFSKYLKQGDDSLESVKVQDFLNLIFAPTSGYPTNGIPLSKDFTKLTANKVSEFQSVYKEIVLKPWDLKAPTARWYQTTRSAANTLMNCSEGSIKLDNGVKVTI